MSGKPAARLGDAVAKGKIVTGSTTVLIGDTAEGRADRCPVCEPAVGSPVNPLLGIKLLPAETDFVLAAPRPFVFSRSYVSNDERVGCLGRGWTAPGDGLVVEADATATVFVDAQGRRIAFGPLAPGEIRFSGSEDLWIRRGGPIVPQLEALEPWRGRWGRIPPELQHDPDSILVMRGTVALHFERRGARWRLSAELDPAGYRTAFHRSAEGHVHHVVDSAGRRYLYVYTSPPATSGLRLAGLVLLQAGERVPSSLPAHQEADWLVRYEYSAQGDLVAVRDRVGHVVRRFSWHRHLMVAHEHADGAAAAYEWDDQGRVRVQRETDGLARRYAYLVDRTEVTDDLGRTEIYHFSGDGAERRWTALTRPDGSRIGFEYDAFGRQVASIDPLGRIRRSRRDGAGRVVGSVDADGSAWQITRDDDTDLVIAVEDPDGRRWSIERDARGNPACVTGPDGATTRYAYADARLPDRPTAITDAGGGTKRLAWNPLGQLASWTDCSGNTTAWRYDAEGRLVARTDAQGLVTRVAYDRLGRPVRTTYPDGSVSQTDWSAAGQPLRRTRAGHTTSRHYDRRGRLIRIVDAEGRSLRYRYDLAGRLVALENENGARARFEYDALDRLCVETGFDARARHYRYNAADELVEVREADERVTRYRYDAAGRLVARDIPATDAALASVETFRWSRGGALIEACNADAATRFEYDPSGRRTLETQIHADDWCYSVAHRYNPLGGREASRYGDAPEIEWLTYGPGHLHGVRVGAFGLDFERDALHREVRRLARHDDDALFEAGRRYDLLGRLQEQRLAFLRGESPASAATLRRYAYSPAGLLSEIEDSAHGTTRYAYDATGRLIESRHADARPAYRFDPAGNRVEAAPAAARRTPNPFDSAEPGGAWPDNRITEFEGRRYRYDLRGNLVERHDADGSRLRLHYDGVDRLVRLRRESAAGTVTEAHYRYDALSRRIAKTVTTVTGTTTKRFGWDADRQVAEAGLDGQRTTVFEPDSFVPLLRVTSAAPAAGRNASVSEEPEDEDDASAAIERKTAVLLARYGLKIPTAPPSPTEFDVEFFHTDHLGTPLSLTNTEGGTIWRARPDDWAAVRDEQGTTDQPIRFQGQYFDVESGLHYNRHRYYEPILGRYVTQDPIGMLGGINVYKYTANPVSRVDPLGLSDSLYDLEPYTRRPVRWDGQPWGAGCGDAKSDWFVPDGIGRADFTRACGQEEGHDGCYGTWGAAQEACDEKLKIDMTAVCDEKLEGLHLLYKPVCKAMGSFYRLVLNDLGFGRAAFDAAQEEAFWKMVQEK